MGSTTRVAARLLVVACVAGGVLAFAGVVLAAIPTADSKSVQTNQGVAKTIQLSGTADSGASDFAVTSGPSHGGLDSTSGAMSCDASTPAICTVDVLYTPVAGRWTDSFAYTVSNATDGTSLAATVSITVDASPVAVDDPDTSCATNTTGNPKRFFTAEDTALTVTTGGACGLLDNDTDADSGDTLTAAKLTNPLHGAVTVTGSGGFTYTPNANYNGLDSFTYTVSDGLRTDSGTVLLTVNSYPDPPNAVNDTTFTVPKSAPATALPVLANDTYLPDAPDTLTIVAVTQGAHGAVVITGGGTGLTYQPQGTYLGSDSFTYTIRDSDLLQDTATVVLTVGGDSTPPVLTAPVQSIRTGLTMGTGIAARVSWSGTDTSGIHHYVLQLQVDGGAFNTIGLPTLTTTSITPSFALNHTFRYRVRAVDNNGNGAAYVYGPTFKTFRYEESQSAVVSYVGAWTQSALTPSYSGNYTRYTYTAGRSATLTAAGRDFAFVAPVGSFRGSARIYVDGVWVKTISEFRSTSASKQVLWSTHFSSLTTHTIRVVVLGNGRIDLDCFLVLR